MKITSHDSIPASLASGLASFERSFIYPLGSAARFRISHGEDYMRFFHAMGSATAVLSERDGGVDGCIVRVKREIIVDGGGRQPVHYLCDLKVREDRRGSAVLGGLLRAVQIAIEGDETTACYCVVMEGTGRLPTDYTGRIGVPSFLKVGEIMILKLSLKERAERVIEASAEDFRNMAIPGYRVTGGSSRIRSMMQPIHLTNEDACGLLEDTRKAKRLFLEGGEEMVSAHVSSFMYRTAGAGARLLVEAVVRAALMDVASVFVAVPRGETVRLLPELTSLNIIQAPAAIYAHGLAGGHDWWIDTAEI